MSRFFVTTPIFYANAAPHIGHCHTLLIADALHRFNRLLHPGGTSIFSTGTDEHGLKIQRAASDAGVAPREFCDNVSATFRNLTETFDCTQTHFVRTTNTSHVTAVQHFWERLRKAGHIYKGTYEGWYSIPDECFVTDIEEVQIKGETRVVDRHTGRPLEWVKEANYMFKLSKFKDDLLHWLDGAPEAVRPKRFHTQLRAQILAGLDDLSISRSSERVQWAIPVPGDPSQSIYVWLDALTNYLAVGGYPSLEAWPPSVQIIGKDILTFHGVYWPAFLLAAGLELPKSIFCHSHWMVDERKMSKSLGNVVSPTETAKKLTTDGLRYFLLRHSVPHSDSNFTESKAIRILNNELANTYGNLLSRCTGKSVNRRQVFPAMPPEPTVYSKEALEIIDKAISLNAKVSAHYKEGDFHLGLDLIHALLVDANRFIDHVKIWELAKSPQTNLCDVGLHTALEVLRISSILMQPIIPRLSGQVLDRLSVRERFWDDANDLSTHERHLNPAVNSNVFQRIKS